MTRGPGNFMGERLAGGISRGSRRRQGAILREALLGPSSEAGGDLRDPGRNINASMPSVMNARTGGPSCLIGRYLSGNSRRERDVGDEEGLWVFACRYMSCRWIFLRGLARYISRTFECIREKSC